MEYRDHIPGEDIRQRTDNSPHPRGKGDNNRGPYHYPQHTNKVWQAYWGSQQNPLQAELNQMMYHPPFNIDERY